MIIVIVMRDYLLFFKKYAFLNITEKKMRDDKKDEYDIRKQEEVLQESYMMVPDSKNRLETAINELEKLKVNYVHNIELDYIY